MVRKVVPWARLKPSRRVCPAELRSPLRDRLRRCVLANSLKLRAWVEKSKATGGSGAPNVFRGDVPRALGHGID
jgi:hypothetical protein